MSVVTGPVWFEVVTGTTIQLQGLLSMSVVTGPIIHVSSYRAYNPAVWVESSYRDYNPVTGPTIHVSSYRAYNPAVWVEVVIGTTM